jgi:hypothetical protein
MKRQSILIVAFASVMCAATAGAQTINTLTPQEKAQGWQLLFDGKTLTGWHSSAPPPPAEGRGRGGRAGAPAPPPPQPGARPQIGTNPAMQNRDSETGVPPGSSHWEVINGTLTPCGEPTGYLTSDRSYTNFVLSLEFNTGPDTNSGVFVRSPKEAGGSEVQIWRQQPAGYNTGSIVSTGKTAKDFSFRPDQWNQFVITAEGDHLTVVLNGETTLDVHDARFPDGNIRLQYQQFPISFRNIKLRPLP